MMEAMFGGHIPEEPPRRGGGGDFGVKLDPKKMAEALKDGTVNEAAITRAAGRVLYEIVHFGYMDGQSKHEVTEQSIEANAKIIEKTGEEAAVLLKNEGGALPLKAADLDSVVLIGPTAGQVDSIGINGERSVGLPERQVGPLDGSEEDHRQREHQVRRGRRHDRHAGSGQRAEPRRQAGPGAHRRRRRNRPTPDQLHRRQRSCLQLDRHLEGHAHPPHAGTYWLYLQAMGTNASIAIDGKRLARHRRLPGRRAWRHPASQPGQRHSHHRRPRQCAPRG
jgi:beta-glucosidase